LPPFDLDTYHEARSSAVADKVRIFLGEVREEPGEMCADAAGVVGQMLVSDDVQHGVSRRRGERVSGKRRAVVAGLEGLGCRAARKARADGDAAAQALREGHDIRDDAVPLIGPEAAGPPDTGLHLVEDEERAVPVGKVAGGLQVFFGGGPDAALRPEWVRA
jgi:hypothetical protein